jgi:hypothetical protein
MSHKAPVPEGSPLHSVGDTPAAACVTGVQERVTDTPAGGRGVAYSRGETPALPQMPAFAPKDSRDTRVANIHGETPGAFDANAMERRMLRPIPRAERYRLFYEQVWGRHKKS